MNNKMNDQTAQKIADAIVGPLSKVPKLNEGGCGVVACCIAEALIKAGYEAKIIEVRYLETDFLELIYGNMGEPTDFKENARNIHNAAANHAIPLTCNAKGDDHFCVKCDNYYFDSHGFCQSDNPENIPLKYEGRTFGEIPLSDFKYVSLESREGMWNKSYNPSYNETVCDIISNGLSFLTDKK